MGKIIVKYSVEMMDNYIQAELISPQKLFEAYQAADGSSLLFSINSDDEFIVTLEESTVPSAGWSKFDLSSTQLKKDFPGDTTVSCKTFNVGQSAQDGTLGLAMVVSTNSGDRLYLSLGNSNKDLKWVNNPNWIEYTYDNPNIKHTSLEICKSFFCETSGGVQYILVDVVRDPSSAVKIVQRFYIDPTALKGYHWVTHDLPIDIEIDAYDSCIGRAPNGYVDGIYTTGRSGEAAQLNFTPVINVFSNFAPPTTVRLKLPDGTVPLSIASISNSDLSTDLFVISGNTLFWFASDNQSDNAIAMKLFSRDIFLNTVDLFAMRHEDVITLWGRNGSDQIFYTKCNIGDIADESKWSEPLPILSGVERCSPYINCIDGGNTIFADSAGILKKITQSLDRSGIWKTEEIKLPVSTTAKPLSFNSYTTSIQLLDEQNLPFINATISLRSDSRCQVYINGLFYILDTSPIHVVSNQMGMITIMQATSSLIGNTFTIDTGSGTSLTIVPSDKPFTKLASLTTVNDIRAAMVVGSDGTSSPLVSSTVSDSDLSNIAAAMGELNNSYNSLSKSGNNALVMRKTAPLSCSKAIGLDNSEILVLAGDIFNWLKSESDYVIEIIKDTATEMWQFAATIGGKVYKAVLDTVHAVVGAVEWIFKQIGTGIKKVIDYVKFIFQWNDIRRSKEVIHNLIMIYLQDQVNGISTFRQFLDEKIEESQKAIAQYTDIKWETLGEIASKPAVFSASNPSENSTAGSQHFTHHFQNNLNNISVIGCLPQDDIMLELIDDLVTAFKDEETVFNEVIEQLKELASDFSSLSVGEVLKRLFGIISEGVLGSSEVLVDVILRIIQDLFASMVNVLDTKIHIPIISDILNTIGISDLSLMDLFCWIGAVEFTVGYKIAHNKAPFEDDANTTFLINAKSMEDINNAFSAPAVKNMEDIKNVFSDSAIENKNALITLPVELKEVITLTGHGFSGLFTFASVFVNSIEAAEKNDPDASGLSIGMLSAALGVASGATNGIANFLAPAIPIKNAGVSALSTGTTIIRVIFKLAFSNFLQKRIAPLKKLNTFANSDNRQAGAVVDSILVLPSVFCTLFHFIELTEEPESKRLTDAILDEVSNITSYISRIAYCMAVNDDDMGSKAVIIGVMGVATLATSGLQTAECAIIPDFS